MGRGSGAKGAASRVAPFPLEADQLWKGQGQRCELLVEKLSLPPGKGLEGWLCHLQGCPLP